jgi:hypothetical protein
LTDLLAKRSRFASRSVNGGPSTTIPAVASTESAKANERATQGSATSIPSAASAISGTPRTGRPVRCTRRPTTAIADALVIEGSGRTSTTNPSSTPIAATDRTARGTPTDRPSSTTSATMTAQFDPDTAVRCVSADVSMARSVSGSSPDRSPIASPRSSAAPGSGRSSVTSRKADRAAAVPPSRPCGGSVTTTPPRLNRTNAVTPPGSSCCS